MLKMLKASFLTLLLVTLGMVLAGCPDKTNPNSAKAVRVVAILSTLGKPAAYGKDNKAGLELAKEQLDAGGGINGVPLDITFEDTDGTPAAISTLIRQYANDPSYLAILGPTTTDETTTAANLLPQMREPLPLLSVGSTGAWQPNGGEFNAWTFRSTRVDSVVVPELMRTAQAQLKVHRIGIIYHPDNEWSMSVLPVYERACQELGIEVVVKEAAALKGTTDWAAQLTKVKAANVDALVVNTQAGPGPKIVAQARDMGLKMPCIGTAAFTNPQTWDVAGTALDHTYVGDIFDPEADTPEVKDFKQRYQSKFGRTPPAYAAYAHAGLTLLAAAIRKSGTPLTRQGLRDALGGLKDVHTVLGTVSCQGKGDITQHPVVLVIQNKAYRRVK